MCLLKVYLESENSGRRLIAKDVALVSWGRGEVRVKNIDFEEIVLKDVDIVLVDALNSILVIREWRPGG
jgi:hypothetical protein